MDLTGFKKLSKEQYEALSERDQVKYELQSEAYNEQKEKAAIEAAEKSAKEAAEKAIAAFKEQAEKDAQEKLDAAVKVVKDEMDAKLEQAQLGMKRVKEEASKDRIDSLSKSIQDTLSHDDNQKSWNEMRAGSKSGIISNFEMKAPAASMPFPTSASRDQWVAAVEIPTEPIHVRNIVPVTSTSLNAIKYIRWGYGADGNLINYVAQGDLKPQVEYVPQTIVANVVKVAGHITVNDELFEDLDGSRASIARMLPQSLYDVEDAFILRTGQGGADELESIWNVAPDWVPTGSVTPGSNTWDKLVSGQTNVIRAKGRVTAAWISPEAYQELLINKDSNEAYTYPIIMGNDNVLRVGNIPVFYHNVFAANEGILGDFYGATELFQKKAVEVRYSREHADNFTHNRTTILIEVREAFAIYRPYSFVKFENLAPVAS